MIFGVFGCSGFGREVMPLVKRKMDNCEKLHSFFFVDDNKPELTINGHPVLTFEEFCHLEGEKELTIAIANSQVRKTLYSQITNNKYNIKHLSIAAENVVVLDAVELGENYILSPFVTLTSNIKIGKGFHANLYSYVGHDCIIGDFVTFAPGVKCNGNVVIEDNVYVGTGAIIKQGKPGRPLIIKSGAVIGAGAVVTKNISENLTVIGNPARPLSRDALKNK